MKRLMVLMVLLLAAVWGLPLLWKKLPAAWDPFAPLSVTDAPTWVTRYKLKQLVNDTDACFDVLQRAAAEGLIDYQRLSPLSGNCPLAQPVRIRRFGDVALSAPFLSSCALAVSSTMWVNQTIKPLALAELGSPLVRIDHLGSYACRNIYHRAQGRLSEHASADAWDISAFQLQGGQRISVLQHWSGEAPRGAWLQRIFGQSCPFYGNALGPEYNAAHRNHFHLGMRGYGLCR